MLHGKLRTMRISAATLVLLLASINSAWSARLINVREVVGMRDACTVLTDEIPSDVYGFETTCHNYLSGWLDALYRRPYELTSRIQGNADRDLILPGWSTRLFQARQQAWMMASVSSRTRSERNLSLRWSQMRSTGLSSGQ